jgi:SpoVK/Ycf46/Vps4 family AAA+-type ATPase
MAEGRILRQLIKAGALHGDEDFVKAAEALIQEERAKKHHLLANDLERILYGESSTQRYQKPTPAYDIPIDRERGLPLIEVSNPIRDFQDVVLSDDNKAVLHEVLLEQNRVDVLGSYGLKPIARLLFCGPPGCGKTVSAEALATELGLELVTIRFDAVVSSFLGETAANLRKVFDFLDRGRFIALFDEFDAIGKNRSDSAEHGELKRVVNAFLQMMDSYRGRSLLVAATNYEKYLDPALWRRFDEVLVFTRPNVEQIHHVLSTKLQGIRHDLQLEDRIFLSRFKGFSYADIERIVIRGIKSMILSGREFLTLELMDDAIRREEHRKHVISTSQEFE